MSPQPAPSLERLRPYPTAMRRRRRPRSRRRRSALEQTELARAAHRVLPAGRTELAIDALHVRLHGVDRDEELARDVRVRHDRREVVENLALAIAERLDQLARCDAFRRGPVVEERDELSREPAVGVRPAQVRAEQVAERASGVDERTPYGFGLRKAERVFESDQCGVLVARTAELDRLGQP